MEKKIGVKKVFAGLMAAVVAASLAACGAKGGQTGDSAKTEKIEITDALTLLNTVWDSYGEEEKFSAAGGDFSEENSVMGGPGRYGIEDAASLDAMLGLPEEAASKIDGAASLMHMMNANTFTCGAFHVGSAGDLADVASSLKDNILSRQWMCGFPDKLIVITVGDYVVSAFGNEELIDTFQGKVLAAYPAATLVYEEAIE